MKNFSYERKWSKAYSAVPTVISVGNIVAGGVGKTPFTLKLAKELLQKEIKLAILSRGYLSKFEHQKLPTQISKGQGPIYLPEDCGDEPYLISQNVPQALFFVGKDRIQSAQMAHKEGAEVLLLDDAMQHRRLHRDFEITLLDAQDPFGKRYFLPYGLLREPITALKRSHLIVLNRVENIEDVAPILEELKTYTQAPCLLTRVKTTGIFELKSQTKVSIEGVKVAAFCGLGNPQNFYKTVKKEGGELIMTHSLKDHRKMSTEQLKALSIKAKSSGADYLICTEKDAVKIQNLNALSLPVLQLKIDLEILSGEESFKNLIHQIKGKKALKGSY